MSEENPTVLGFQFEPEHAAPVEESDASNDTFDYVDPTDERDSNDVKTWCECNYCQVMSSREEYLCCLELDEIKYFKIEGKFVNFMPLPIQIFGNACHCKTQDTLGTNTFDPFRKPSASSL